jgi:hypothetical protein
LYSKLQQAISLLTGPIFEAPSREPGLGLKAQKRLPPSSPDPLCERLNDMEAAVVNIRQTCSCLHWRNNAGYGGPAEATAFPFGMLIALVIGDMLRILFRLST